MGREVYLGGVLGAPLGNGLGLRPQSGGPGSAPTIQVLLVGGGGCGGGLHSIFQPNPASNSWPGGGGGGEVIELEMAAPVAGSYAVVVGQPGLIASPQAQLSLRTTRFGNFVNALGGGNGSFNGQQFGGGIEMDGGSSSGLTQVAPGLFGHAGRALGLNSGAGSLPYGDGSIFAGGGGGGAGGNGLAPTSSQRGLGGPGVVSSITGQPVEYSRGGDGLHSGLSPGSAPTTPGSGGPGREQFANSDGMPGIFILRYLTGTQVWLGGDLAVVGPYTIHKFTTSGTITRLS